MVTCFLRSHAIGSRGSVAFRHRGRDSRCGREYRREGGGWPFRPISATAIASHVSVADPAASLPHHGVAPQPQRWRFLAAPTMALPRCPAHPAPRATAPLRLGGSTPRPRSTRTRERERPLSLTPRLSLSVHRLVPQHYTVQPQCDEN